MTTKSGLLKAAEFVRLVEVHRGWCNYCRSNEKACLSCPEGGCSLRDYIRALAAQEQEPEPEGWKRYEVTFQMPSEHYGDHVFKRDLAGHWFRLKLPELPTERTVRNSPPVNNDSRLDYSDAYPTERTAAQTPCIYDETNAGRNVTTSPATPAGSKRTGEDTANGDYLVPAQSAPAVLPAPMPEEPNYLRLRNGFTVNIRGEEEPSYGEYVLRNDYDALRSHTEVLQREIKYLRACISGKGGYIEVMTARDDELAAIRPVVEAAKEVQRQQRWQPAEYVLRGQASAGNRLASALADFNMREEVK